MDRAAANTIIPGTGPGPGRERGTGLMVIPPEQTLVLQGLPAEHKALVQDAIYVQSVNWTPVLSHQRSSIASLNFVADRTMYADKLPRLIAYANYKDAIGCAMGQDAIERFLLGYEWGQKVTVYVKSHGPDGVPPIGWRSTG
jgi:hypothetical protein